jgi:hypothetical protein
VGVVMSCIESSDFFKIASQLPESVVAPGRGNGIETDDIGAWEFRVSGGSVNWHNRKFNGLIA